MDLKKDFNSLRKNG